MIEGHDTRIALADFEPLDAAAFEYQERAVVVFDDLALLREVGGAFVRIAAVVDEYADEKAVGLAVGDMEGEIAAHGGEAAGLHDIGENVGADLRRPLAQRAQAARRAPSRDEGNQKRDDQRRPQGTAGAAARATHRRHSSR